MHPDAGPRFTAATVAAVALVALAGLAAVYRTDDTDFWFHLAAGRSIAAHGLPDAERWTLSAADERPWLPGWSFLLALWEVFRFGGFAGIALWRALLSAAAVALALTVARTAGARGVWTLAILPLVIAVTRERLQARTEQVFAVLLLFALLCFERTRRGRDRTLWTLPAQLVWVNAHPSWIFSPLLAWLYVIEAWVSGRRGRAAGGFAGRRDAAAGDARARAPANVGAGKLAWIGVALCAFVVLTPPGINLRGVPFAFLADLGARDPLIASIEELRSWSWAQDRGEPFTALLALVLVAVLLGGRRAWQASPPLVVVALAGLASGFAIHRMRAVAALLATPVLLLALEASGTLWRDRATRVAGGVAALAGFAWLLLAPGFEFGAEPQWRAFPVRAVALADSLRLEGPMINTFHLGGYILWVRGDRHRPLVDGRARGTPIFRSQFERASVDSTALDSLLATWRCNHAILEPPRGAHDRMSMALAARPDWTLVFADDAGLLFVKNDVYPGVAAARGYALLTPDYAEL
ncbi:MAG: hypothetical protein ABIS67_10350, partial [Candidatus Eisenbacteria bacterium]